MNITRAYNWNLRHRKHKEITLILFLFKLTMKQWSSNVDPQLFTSFTQNILNVITVQMILSRDRAVVIPK